jgi:hypothetical protein
MPWSVMTESLAIIDRRGRHNYARDKIHRGIKYINQLVFISAEIHTQVKQSSQHQVTESHALQICSHHLSLGHLMRTDGCLRGLSFHNWTVFSTTQLHQRVVVALTFDTWNWQAWHETKEASNSALSQFRLTYVQFAIFRYIITILLITRSDRL